MKDTEPPRGCTSQCILVASPKSSENWGGLRQEGHPALTMIRYGDPPWDKPKKKPNLNIIPSFFSYCLLQFSAVAVFFTHDIYSPA